MKLRKVSAVFLTVALVMTTMAGCGSSGGEEEKAEKKKVTLTVWGPEEEQMEVEGYREGTLKAMCDKFNNEHPEWDITFHYGVCSEGDAKDEVTKNIASAADVYMYANDQIPVLVDSGALSELNGDSVDIIQNENEASMSASVLYNNKVYGVPFTSNTWFMYYDKSKYTEDEVKSLDTMMNKDLGGDVKNFAFPLDNSWYLASFYYAVGCTLFGLGTDPNAGCDFDNADGVAVTKYLVDLAKNKRFSCTNDEGGIDLFSKGKLGAYCSGSWAAEDIKAALGDNFGVAIAPAIKVNDKEGTIKSFAGSKAVGVNPNCKNKDVAEALALYLGNKECQQIRFYARGIAPINKEISESDRVKEDVVTTVQNQEIVYSSVLQPVLKEMDAYWTPAENMGKELVKGNVTAKNAEQKTKEMVKGILNQGK